MKPIHFYLLLSVIAAAGCGRGTPGKVVVTGTVTFQGKAIDNGDILFYPVEGTVGPVSGASIKDGQFSADGKGGVSVGKQRVEIRAYRSGNSAQASTPQEIERVERQGGQRQQYIPAKFNSESTLVIDVDGSASPFIHDFNL